MRWSILTIQRRRDLISERTQIIHRECTLLATAQMISHKLKLITAQVLIHILSRLFTRKMRADIPIKHLLMHSEECGIDIDTRSARLTLSEMIARRQQSRGTQAILRIILNLFLTQVFHRFFF